LQAAVKRRKEEEEAAHPIMIEAARESINYSDDGTPPHKDFYDNFDEVCAETLYYKDESEDGALHSRPGLYKAVIQASASSK
jgi:hypothetical protein